jgi:RNA polymerase sigma-70 factor (ECF subfamily)
MSGHSSGDSVAQRIDAIYRNEGRRAFATLVRHFGDFDRAEEALHEAFRSALEQWPDDGVPDNPAAWLVAAARNKHVDQHRRQRLFTAWDAAGEAEARAAAQAAESRGALDDDRLRLLFTCCHPGLAEEARIALTLREVCGLTTEEIARAFLVPAPTLAQRIVRSKAKIRAAGIPFEVPEPAELPERLASVLRVVYLVFNEGYSATSGDALLRCDLCEEAIRLGRLLLELAPEPEVMGLLALMLLHQSRRATRVDARGDLVPLEEQDRSRWDRGCIAEGCALVERALTSGRFGPYALQAAIAAVHAEAATAAATDWAQIAGLYDALLRREPSPVIELNRAVAVAMRDGPAAGLPLVDGLIAAGRLERYHLAHAARADLCRRLGRTVEAAASYRRAAELAQQEPERRFLARRLAELERGAG